MIQRTVQALLITLVLLGALAAWHLVLAPWYTARQLKRADPVADAAAAIDRGDVRLLAIDGYLLYPPGVDSLQRLVITGHCQIRLVGASGHRFLSPFMARLNIVAHEYAARYNVRLLTEVPSDKICSPAA